MPGMTADEAFQRLGEIGYVNHRGHFASDEEWSKYKHMVPQEVKREFKQRVAGNEQRYAEGRAQGLTPEQMGVFDKKEMGQALLRRMEMGNLDKGYDYDWASGFKTNVGTSDLSKLGKERIPITEAERAHFRELQEAKASGTNIFQQHRQAQIRGLLASGAIQSDGQGGYINPGPGGGERYGANLEGYNLGQDFFGRGRGTGGASTPGGGYTPQTISGPVRAGDSGFTGGTTGNENRTGGGFQAPPGVSTGQPGGAPPTALPQPPAPPVLSAPTAPTKPGGQPEPPRSPATPGPKPGTAPSSLAAPPGVNTGAPGRPSTAPIPSPAAPVRPPAPTAPAPVAPPLPAQKAAGGVQPAVTAAPVAPAAPAALQTTRVPTRDEFAQMGPGATAQTPWGQVVPKADGSPQLVLDEAGKAAFVQARAKAIGDYGPLPMWAQGPGMPPPPVEPGRWNYNVFTSQWSGGPQQ